MGRLKTPVKKTLEDPGEQQIRKTLWRYPSSLFSGLGKIPALPFDTRLTPRRKE